MKMTGMKVTGIFSVLAATTIWASAAVARGDGNRPTTTNQAPNSMATVNHGPAAVTDVAWRRPGRYGYYGYRPYYTYRPYFDGYGYGYGRYYTRPYYGYSYYAPGWGYGGWRPSYGYGVAPFARFGPWYW